MVEFCREHKWKLIIAVVSIATLALLIFALTVNISKANESGLYMLICKNDEEVAFRFSFYRSELTKYAFMCVGEILAIIALIGANAYIWLHKHLTPEEREKMKQERIDQKKAKLQAKIDKMN